MKFFVDLEATQFASRIISMGVVAETGDKFYTLMKPYDDKVTDFIHKLTGLTDEEVQNAPEPDLAFQLFSSWMNEVYYKAQINKNLNPEFIFYGKEDKTFLTRTKTHMTNINSIMIIEAMLARYVDYTSIVKQHFSTKFPPSLLKVYTFCQKEDENIIQHHNALEDAEMLAFIAKELPDKSHNAAELPQIPKAKIEGAVRKKAPDIYISWQLLKNADKWNTGITNANKNDYLFYCQEGIFRQYFKDFSTAALWVIRFVANAGGSPKKDEDIAKKITKIEDALSTGKPAYNMVWVRKEEN